MLRTILALFAAALIFAAQTAFANETGAFGGGVAAAVAGAAVGGPVGAIVGGLGGAAIGARAAMFAGRGRAQACG